MIARSNLIPLRLMDFFQVMNLVNDYLKAEDREALKIEKAYLVFEKSFRDLDDALTQATTIVATKEIMKADEARDKTLTALIQTIRALTSSPQKEQAKKAEKLLSEVEKYGKNLFQLPLREESAVIINLLQDFELPEHKSALESLHLGEWAVLLKEQNDTFDRLYKERSVEQSEIQVGKSKEARDALQDAFDVLVKTINANAFLNGEAPYQALAGKINQEVSRSIMEAKVRKTKKENANASKKQEGEQETE